MKVGVFNNVDGTSAYVTVMAHCTVEQLVAALQARKLWPCDTRLVLDDNQVLIAEMQTQRLYCRVFGGTFECSS